MSGPTAGGRPGQRIHVVLDDLDRLAGAGRAAWDRLFEAQDALANPFCAPEWVETWYTHFTRPSQRHLLTVWRGDELVGVAPFYRDRVALGPAGVAHRLTLAGAGQGGSVLESPQVLTAPGLAREVVRAVVEETISVPEGEGVDWSEIAIPTGAGWFEPEWSYSTGQPVAFYRSQMVRASVVLPVDGGWEATRAGFKRNLKESLRRSRNRIAKDGRTWTVVPRTEDLDVHAVERLLDLHHRRSAHGASVQHADAYASPARQAFLRDLLPRLGARGRATLLELHVDDEVVAVQLALRAPGVTYFHSSGVDPSVWALSPVTYLQEHLVREAAESGARWVNFSPGPNVAKLRWSEQIDTHHDFAYGSGGPSLRWKYSAFAAGQALSQVNHAVSVSTAHAAPARAETSTAPTQTSPVPPLVVAPPTPGRLRVFVRSHGSENLKNRPDFYDKTTCLASLVRAAEQVTPTAELVFLNDGPLPAARERLMASAGEVVQGEFGSNRASWNAAVRLARSRDHGPDDLVWFAEDDYLYRPEAFAELVRVAQERPEVDYFSLYLGEMHKRDDKFPVDDWVPAVSTTSSFGVRRAALQEDARLLMLMTYTGGAFDHTTFLTLAGHYPFTARRLRRDLVPFGHHAPDQWARHLTRGVVRTALGTRGLRRPSHRRTLHQPPQDLIAHLETGAFQPSEGWAELAEQTRAWLKERTEAAGEQSA